jgi:hypothetical protein
MTTALTIATQANESGMGWPEAFATAAFFAAGAYVIGKYLG